MPEPRIGTSFTIPKSVHQGLKDMAELHKRSMSQELDHWFYLARIVEEATEPTRKVIERIVEERMQSEQGKEAQAS